MDDATSKLANYESAVRHRMGCEQRAFAVVNKLIDGAVSEAYLMECGQLLGREHYSDVVEERAIGRLCGLPLCPRSLANIPKKKYHISTKSNKVYDISERKNFCSNECYNQSKHFQNQISETPVWGRKKEAPIHFNFLLSYGNRGSVGEQVIGGNPKKALESDILSLQKEDENEPLDTKILKQSIIKDSATANDLKVNDVKEKAPFDNVADAEDFQPLNITIPNDNSTEMADCQSDSETSLSVKVENLTHSLNNTSLGEKKNLCINVLEKTDVKPQMGENENRKLSDVEKIKRLKQLMAKKKSVLGGMVEMETVKIKDQDKAPLKSFHKRELARKPRKKCTEKEESPLAAITKTLKSWMTLQTVQYLQISFASSSNEASQNKFSDPKIQVGYQDLCKRLNQREREMDDVFSQPVSDRGDKGSNEDSSKPQGKVPDFKALGEETFSYSLKVTEFITGKKVHVPNKSKKQTAEGAALYLPTVDATDQQLIRARLVLDKLDHSLREILPGFGLSLTPTATPLRELIHACRLEADNITFRPAEWTLVSLLLLHLLSRRHPNIHEALQSGSSIRFLDTLLKAIHLNSADFERCVEELVMAPLTSR